MSKEIDETTMGHLMTGGPVHDVRENPTDDVLLSGTVVIRKTAEDLEKASALKSLVERAIATIKAIAPCVIAVMLVSAVTQGYSKDRPTWAPRGSFERSWGTLSKEALQIVHDAALKMPSSKIDIICGLAACQHLAEDLDEALESAGHDVTLGMPMFDIGKGAAISPANDTTLAIAAAIKSATGYSFKVLVPKTPDGKEVKSGKIVIAIGRKPRD